MNSKLKSTSFVAISSIVNTILLTAYGLIYNNLIMVNYGSSTTGLISTLTQFVSLFSIVEGGFSLAVVVASYTPIINKDYIELNNILYTAKKYFNKITGIYVFLVTLSGICYVYILETPIGFIQSILLLGMTISSTALSIGGLSKYTVVLSGHNKQYITVIISIICKTITWLIALVLIIIKMNIVVVYSLNVANILLNIFGLKYYEKIKFPYVTYRGSYDLTKIKGVKDMFFQKVAATVFTSADLVLVSVGLNLSKASVYYIYNQIFQAVYQYLTSIGSAPTDSFGQLIKSAEIEKVSENFSIYKKTIHLMGTIFLSTTAVMIIPFLRLYTYKVTDEDYIIPSLAIAFYSYYFIKLCNTPYGMIINVSGLFEMQNLQTGLAAIVNIVASFFLMRIIGLNGIVLGSVIGTLIILLANVHKSAVITLHSQVIDYFLLLCNYMCGIVLIYLGMHFIKEGINNYIVLLFYSIIIFFMDIILALLLNLAIDRKGTKKCLSYYINKVKMKLIT